MVNTDVLWLDDVRRTDVALAGGKRANLGELIASGFRVPPGFVVTVPACERFFSSVHVSEAVAGLSDSSPSMVAACRAAITETIRTTDIPAELEAAIMTAHRTLRDRCGSAVVCAVRSSATAEDLGEASFAGQHGTYYYVDEDRLLPMIRNCTPIVD